jgi:LmbE family N-acetylglucosaminyl deacetylase
MIVPITLEEEWLATLESLPVWNPQPKRAAIIAPHPDDETLGAGGFIARLRSLKVETLVVAVTNGEKAYGYDSKLAEVRQAEQREALACLDVPPESIVRLNLPDSDVVEHEPKLVDLLLPLVGEDTLLVAPWSGDFHPDHEACGRAAERVATQTGAQLCSYFFWTWHRGTPSSLDGLTLRALPLSQNQLHRKLKALQCHRSQLEHDSGEPILPGNLLGPANRSFEVFSI